MTVNFQTLLSKPVDSVKRPTAKPAGTYFGTIASYKFDESKQNKTPFVRFVVNNVQFGPDIDPEQQKDAEGAPIDLSKYTPHKDYYLTDDAMYRTKEFLESLKINTSGRTFAETIPEAKGLPVQFTLTMEPAREGEGFYNNISAISGVEG